MPNGAYVLFSDGPWGGLTGKWVGVEGESLIPHRSCSRQEGKIKLPHAVVPWKLEAYLILRGMMGISLKAATTSHPLAGTQQG